MIIQKYILRGELQKIMLLVHVFVHMFAPNKVIIWAYLSYIYFNGLLYSFCFCFKSGGGGGDSKDSDDEVPLPSQQFVPGPSMPFVPPVMPPIPPGPMGPMRPVGGMGPMGPVPPMREYCS